jgi:hypothetical protein
MIISGGSIMKKFVFAAVLTAGFVSGSNAADTPPATTTAPATPVVVEGQPMTVSTGTVRRGLFSRLRGRTTTAPVMTTTPTVVTPATTTPAAPAPMPMKVSGTEKKDTAVVQASGTTTATTTTTPVSTMTTSTTAKKRMGMVSRIRARR